MPREFYPDTDRNEERSDELNCLNEIDMWDGPGICMRKKGHRVDAASPANGLGEFHQEALEGWVWNDNGLVG